MSRFFLEPSFLISNKKDIPSSFQMFSDQACTFIFGFDLAGGCCSRGLKR
jgi:hypothetical protein